MVTKERELTKLVDPTVTVVTVGSKLNIITNFRPS